MQIGIIGSGTWATALAKLLTDNRLHIHWWVRHAETMRYLRERRHNPHYLTSVRFDPELLNLHLDANEVFQHCECVVIALPSAYAADMFRAVRPETLHGKWIVSAIKGMLPERNVLLNDYLAQEFGFNIVDYFTIMGPCHAEEVAAEKLSYLTFSGADEARTTRVAAHFQTPYLNTITNDDVIGVQYAAILKNIYALGAGIAHGLEYGDNFLSVLIANCADEMAGFLHQTGMKHVSVGTHNTPHKRSSPNYAASVYLGDLLVTCYSLFSRNRTFGNMIGKGYSVNAARLELNMVAEGYQASRSIYEINKKVGASMPIAETVYRILWENLLPAEGMKMIEEVLV